MVARASVRLRRLAGGCRAELVRYGRFLANPKVTVAALIAGWAEQTAAAAAGRHVLAIQDTSEINFATSAGRRRGLGEIGKGVGRGLLVHPVLALDAASGSCLGLVTGQIWTRKGRITVPHGKRLLADKESARWLTCARASKTVLAEAALVTMVADRESDLYAEWATLPEPGFHLITRAAQDRSLSNGQRLYATAAGFPVAARAALELRWRGPKRPARTAGLALRFGPVTLKRPKTAPRDLPKSVTLSLVEVVEEQPPEGVEPLHWRLLTTHPVAPDWIGGVAAAWRIVAWYKMRWAIEQLFRLMKTEGIELEDSQLDIADRLLKLAAVATKAAAVMLQLVQARDGHDAEPASIAFGDHEIDALDALNARTEGKTALQKNPHPRHSLAWAGWIIARRGGWDGYPSSRPPGPITFRHGLEYFHAFAAGWQLRDVCIP